MLPKNLKYGSKIESAVARSSRVNIQPQNGTSTYGPNDTIIFNIPTRNNLVMVPTESYLKFDIRFTSGADLNAFRWDSAGAHGIIQRIRVFAGSNLLQDIDSYGMLAKMLFDLQQPTDAVYGKQNILAGTRADLAVKMPTITPLTANAFGDINVALAQVSTKNMSAVQANSGERLLTPGGGNGLIATTASTDKITYCLNLISLVGSLCSSSYIPLFAMTSAPLRVEIQLVPNAVNACGFLTGGLNNTFSITNCEYVANMIELGDSAVQIIYSSLGGEPLQFVVPDFRNYQFNATIPTGNVLTQIAFPIPAKFTSLKALFITVRDKGTGTATFFPYSSVTCGLQEYSFRLGATTMPSKNPSTLTECFAEVVKAIGSIGDIHYSPSIDKVAYTLPVSGVLDDVATVNQTSIVNSGSFYIGIDLENYAAADKSQLFSGYTSTNDDVFAFLSFSQNTGAINARFDAFANFDTVVVCENQTCYVKF